MMSGTLKGVLTNTTCHRALVQLMVGAAMAVAGIGLHADFDMWVAHVDDAGAVDFVQLSGDFALMHAPRVWAALRAYRASQA